MRERSILLRARTVPERTTGAVRNGFLMAESASFTALALVIPVGLGVDNVGLYALFLMSASTSGRLKWLLAENKDRIFGGGWTPWRANGAMAASVAMMFAGICLAYLGATVALGIDAVTDLFGFALHGAGLQQDTLLTRDFSGAWGLLAHNGVVLACIVGLCLAYRAYGAMLALGFNAAVWVFVLATLTQRAFSLTDMDPVLFSVAAAAAMTPHLVLEGCAYVLGALAGIFTSRALFRYSLDDDVLYDVITSSAVLIVTAVGLLALAAATEAHWATSVLEWLRFR